MKKLSKKLSLNKETIASLSNDQLLGVKGGGHTNGAGYSRRNPTKCATTGVTKCRPR